MGLRQVFSFGKDLWDPSHRFETSWILPPVVLAACRALISIYIFTTRFFIIGFECSQPEVLYGGCTAVEHEFSYFTVITYWALGFYFAVSAAHTFSYALGGAPFLDRFPRPLQALHSLYYTTIVTYPFLVTIVYWVILYKNGSFTNRFALWSNVSQHAMNSGFALFEILVPRTSSSAMLWIHVLWLIVILALYLGVAYITHATEGWYTYSFLDPAKGSGKVAGYVFGIAAAIIVIYLLAKGLVWARQRLTEGVLRMDGKFAHQRSRPDDAEMQSGEPKVPVF